LGFRHSGPPKNPALPDSVASAEIPGPRRLTAKFNRLQKPATSCTFFPDDPPRFYKVPFSYHRIDPIKASLEAAGFLDLKFTVLTLNKEIESANDFARGLIHGNPIVDEIRKRSGVHPDHVVNALTVALHQQYGVDPAPMTLQAIVVESTKK
jgi:hypothetical protein